MLCKLNVERKFRWEGINNVNLSQVILQCYLGQVIVIDYLDQVAISNLLVQICR